MTQPPPGSDALTRLLAGQFADPDDPAGSPLTTEVGTIAVANSLAGDEAQLVRALGIGRRLAIVSDRNTHAALGSRVERALSGSFTTHSVVLPGEVHANDEALQRLTAAVDPRADAVIAVGSGTINDLCKLVAHERHIPQIVFATAPSMNGYASANAAVTIHGHKKSVRTHSPIAVFVDLQVLCRAPLRLIRAGLGDSSCRATAQTDWLLAHRLRGLPYRTAPFALLAGDEAALFADPRAVIAGDMAAMRHLVQTLILSGIGMTLCGGSYPASQGEHLIAHYLGMRYPDQASASFHGEQIAVTTLTMATLQTAWLQRDRPPQLGPTRTTEAELRARFGDDLGGSFATELAGKRLATDEAERQTEWLAQHWDELRAELSAIGRDHQELHDFLIATGTPMSPAELGWSADAYVDAVRSAHLIRNRVTLLDVLADERA